MAPKKKTESSSFLLKIPKEKISKTKPFKPKNILKVKIPVKNVKNAVGEKKKKTLEQNSPAQVEVKDMLTMNPQNDMKIDRMNEVARAQLLKDFPVTESAPAPVAKKRGRKKKIPEPETAEVVPKKKPKLPTKAKVPTKNTTKKVPNTKTPKETAEVVPKEKPKLPTKAKVPTKKTTKKVANTKTPKVAAQKRKASTKISPSISPPPKRQRNRALKRGKPADDNSTITSPSILSFSRAEVETPVTETQKTVAKSPVGIKTTENNNESRRTSITSAPASEFSSTKDISGSSTTTCITVTSNDFVRIDGKLPELKLTKLKKSQIVNKKSEEAITQMEPERSLLKDSNINSFSSSSKLKNSLIEDKSEEPLTEKMEPEHSLSEDSSSSSSSSSCSSSSSSSSSQSDKSAKENGLNLSTSSITAPPYSPTYTPRNQSCDKTKQDEVTSMLEMLAPKLKSRDLYFSDIEGEDEDDDTSAFMEKVAKNLEEEYYTILECSGLNRIELESCLPNTTAPEIEHEHSGKSDFAMSNHTAIPNKSACDNFNDTPSNITRRRDTYGSDVSDDDVLQLYATDNDLDSTRMGSAASTFEEYVPQPLIQRPHTAVTYQPSKIDEPEIASEKKTVCEKQNADSTSIHKEPELDDASNETPEAINGTGLGPKPTNKSPAENKRPPLTIYYYPFRSRFRSAALSGVCFLNLSSMCKRQDQFQPNHFPHRFIEEGEFRIRIAKLGEKQFIEEYNNIARWPILRKKYVTCFIDECQRRELPKILVEIVIDFLLRTPPNITEDEDLRVEVIEHALIHLNNWDLMVCEQLLEYNLGDEVLCDVFIKIIPNTQNFSRFKNVFVNLTDFMVRANRTFDFGVVFHILERVCILPFDASLAMSLISILGNTDRKIFKNSFINRFELLLETNNKELYNRYLSIKMEGVSSVGLMPASEPGASLSPSLQSPCGSRGSRELEPLIINSNNSQEFEQRYTSPDTTNVDNVVASKHNKHVTEPTIVRTFNHLSGRPPSMGMCLPRPPPPRPPPPRPRAPYRKWDGRSILSQIPRMPYMRLPRPMKKPLARPGQPPSKFDRRYGPDF